MKIGKPIARFGKRRDGIASLEFVLILFPTMIFIFGMLEFGLMFYHFNQMQGVARETARQVAVDDDLNPGGNGADVNCPGTAGTAEALACQLLSGAAKDTVTVCYRQDDLPPDTPVFSSVVTVSAPMDQIGIVTSIMGIASDRTLTASADMRVEPGKIGPAAAGAPFTPPNGSLCDGSSPQFP